MNAESIAVRSEHPAEWLAALPVLVGYELTDRATLTFTGPSGQLICVAAVPDTASTEQIRTILAAQAASIRAAGVQATFTTVHGLNPTDAQIRSQALADAAAAAGLPRPHPQAQFTVDGTHAWPVTGHPTPAPAGWDLRDYPGVRDRLELLLGTPAASRADVGADLAPAPSPLRDDIAAALPDAAADPAATTDPARWRVHTAAGTLARLTDPRPWTGQAAATTLLALSDQRVLASLIAHTLTRDTHALTAPDTGLLTDLVRSAPPGLVAGPATLLASRLAGQGLTSVRARTAASLAVADRPDATTALALLAALDRGDNPRTLLADLVERAPSLVEATPPLFTTGDGTWPDPLASPTPDTAPQRSRADHVDPLAAPPTPDPRTAPGPAPVTPPKEGPTP